MQGKMRMRVCPGPCSGMNRPEPCCVDFSPFMRPLEAVGGEDDHETAGDMSYGGVEASVGEVVRDGGWGECLVLVERRPPFVPAPVIYRCTRSKGVVNCEVVAS